MHMLGGTAAQIAERLYAAGHEVYLVGGAVRDRLLGVEPHDIDLATTALPEQVLELFPGGKDDGAEFGRVLIEGVDVLTLREDGEYKDARRPSRVVYTTDIVKDLARRDFTINAMAMRYPDGVLIDPFGGETDILLKTVRAVGDATVRFLEDALRLMRAVRFAGTLGFGIDEFTRWSMQDCAHTLSRIAPERIRDELSRMLVGEYAHFGLGLMEPLGLLEGVIPELQAAVGCEQRCPNHRLDVWGHTLAVVNNIQPVLHLRLAALLHDVGKPATKQTRSEGRDTFYNHEHVGGDMAREILERLRYPNDITEKVVRLVDNHMFHFDKRTTPGAVRRLIVRVGPENVDDLLELRRADHAGARTAAFPQGRSYTMLHEIAEQMRTESHAITVKDLALNGYDVMYFWNLRPGPLVGVILECCLNYVLDDPSRNTREVLTAFIDDQMKQEGTYGLG